MGTREPGGSDGGWAYEADERNAFDYFRALYKRRWLGAAVFGVVLASAFLYVETATRIYEATTRLHIEMDAPNVVNFEEVIAESRLAMRSEYYRTQYEILRSRVLARMTLDRLDLWEHPAFSAEGEETGFDLAAARALLRLPLQVFAPCVRFSSESARICSSTARWASSSAAEAEAGEIRAESVAINRFVEALEVVPVRDSRIVDITFRSRDGRLAATVVNGLAEAYIEQHLTFRNASSRDASDWLRQRIAEQRARVESSELALQLYRETHGAVSLEDRQNIIGQELADLNAAATRASADRIAHEARYREMQAVQHDPAALNRLPEILRNTFIQQQKARLADLQREEAALAEELGDLHPDLISIRSAMATVERRLEDEVAKVVASVRTEFEVARREERQLRARLDRQTEAALVLDRAGIEFGVLAREAESARRIYESLLQRADETSVTEELRTSSIRVLDAAETPLRPAQPRPLRTLLFGLFGGGLLAVGVVFFADYLDGRLKTPDDVRAHLGQPYLGMLPKVDLGDTDRAEFRIEAAVPENFVAAVRTIRTSLFFSSAEEGCRSVLVTSAEPGDGKSVLACNLAISIAQSGQRTLLVDADLRRPRMHEHLGVDRAPGLSDLMVGQAETDEVVREADLPGLAVLSAGKESPNPTELIASRRFGAWLEAARDRYDWIVADAPPVLPITDATIIARGVNHILFVVDAEATHRRTAKTALERLSAVGARVTGIVLNKVDLDGHPYYYSHYYRRDYRRYYHA